MSPGRAAPEWETDGADWPNREHSRFATAGGLRWHVQRAGSGPTLLLLHGTGAATHSWRDLLPLLAGRFDVVAPDLPGHGFTTAPPPHDLSLPAQARAVAGLLHVLGAAPAVVVGHSAGAAIGARLILDGRVAPTPRLLVGINAAILPLRGPASDVFAPLARVLTRIPLVPAMFARRAGDGAMVERLLRATGSTLDARGVALYQRVAAKPRHAAAALAMMAHWDLAPLVRDLPRLAARVTLIVGEGDRTIPPADAANLRRVKPEAEVVTLPGLGHLAHEEAPERVAGLIADAAGRAGV